MIRASYRGQPLVALLLILGGWVTLRYIAWEAGGPGGPFPAEAEVIAASAPQVPPVFQSVPTQPQQSFADTAPISDGMVPLPRVASGAVRFWREAGPIEEPPPLPAAVRLSPAPRYRPEIAPAPSQEAIMGSSFQLLPLVAGTPPPSSAAPQQLTFTAAPAARETQPSARWSADSWALLRRGGGASLAGNGPATYGASQVGAALRYRLAPSNGHRPAAYLRTSAALNGSQEREAALGLSARPFARIPLVAAVEGRVYMLPGYARLRPAAFIYTEFAPLALPLGAQAEFYGQAGYVGGDFASAFADGQLRIDRRFLRLGPSNLRIGGGLWGGAQVGAARLDVGPTASIALPLGRRLSARLSADWRFRVTGNAAPSSGPAMTLSAGF